MPLQVHRPDGEGPGPPLPQGAEPRGGAAGQVGTGRGTNTLDVCCLDRFTVCQDEDLASQLVKKELVAPALDLMAGDLAVAAEVSGEHTPLHTSGIDTVRYTPHSPGDQPGSVPGRDLCRSGHSQGTLRAQAAPGERHHLSSSDDAIFSPRIVQSCVILGSCNLVSSFEDAISPPRS